MEVMPRTQFLAQLLTLAHSVERNNWDWRRFGKDGAGTVEIGRMAWWLDYIVQHWPELDQSMAMLADDASRALLQKLLLYRALGHLHVRLPTNTEEYWRLYDSCDQYIEARDVDRSWTFPLSRFRYEDVVFVGNELGLINLFLMKQYYYQGATSIAPEPGDVVIDAGGCWGDSSLAFARSVGPRGKVHVFEFVDSNLAIARRNFALNPGLAPQIDLVEHAVGGKSGDVLHYEDRGPATRLTPGAAGASGSTTTLTIDDLVARRGLPRVDFIKMDVEGAETMALVGAENTIRAHHPKLAISLYHRPEDLLQIPQLIKAIDPRYQLHLGHYTIHAEETVLYAKIP